MATKENLGPANNYEFGKNHFDTLASAFANLKQELNRHGWNVPVEQMDGLTMTMEGRDKIRISHVKYVVASPYQMNQKEKPVATAFVSDMVNQLSKRYKEMAKTSLTLTKLDENQDIELYSKLQPDQSWAFGTSYGVAVARYMITTSQTYSVKSANLSDE